jgi:putative peptide zinc metalloprotease protein
MAAVALAAHPEPISAPPPPVQENVVLPALRPDLVVNQQQFEGRTYYVVKDPISLQYFRMTAEDYFLATLFDGKRKFGEIRDIYAQRYPHVLLDFSREELNERVLRFANDLALLQFLNVQGMRLKTRLDAAKSRKKSKGGLYELANKVFFFRRSIFDPDQLFARMARPIGWVWTKTTLWISTVIVILGVIVFLQHTDRVAGAVAHLFSLQNVLLMMLTTFVIKSIHELGHGLTCKHFGGEVHEIGVMCLVFQPYFFVNVSDSWTMPNRMHRVLVGFAGIYVELIFAAFATFLWAIVQPGAFRDFLFNVIFIASISTIMFNANPLMRFDGYYIMMDLLEVPNLQGKSRALIQHQLNNALFGKSNKTDTLSRLPLPRKRFWLFYTYAVLSWLYGYWVIYKLIVFMKPHLEPFGLEGLANWFSALALTSWVLMPFLGFFKALGLTREDWNQGGRMRRLARIGALAIGVFGAACFFPRELKINRSGVVEVAKFEEVRPEVSGFIEQILIEPGDEVKPGLPIAKLSNRDLQMQRDALETHLRMAEAGVQRALGESKPAELKEAQNTQAAYQAKFDEADRDVQQLTLTAHVSGVVLTRELEKLKGRLIKSGELFCEIGSLNPLRIKVPLTEKQVRYVQKGQPVALRSSAFPGQEFHGVIADKPVMFFGNQIPPGFSMNRGGDVMTYIDQHGREVALERTFEAVVEIDNQAGHLRPGMKIKAKISTGTRPWGRLVLQSALDLLSLDFRFLRL